MELQQKLTSNLNDLFSTQLAEVAQWNNVQGELDHISASPAGQLWGIQKRQNSVQFSKDPGIQWNQVETPGSGARADITTDATRVQVLVVDGGTAQIHSRPIDGTGSWTKMTTPQGTRRVVSTKDFLWAETDRGNFTCAQPCQNGNWTAPSPNRMTLSGGQHSLAGTDGNLKGQTNRQSLMGVLLPSDTKVKLTSASGRRAQGVSQDLKAMVNVNGEWQPIPGFTGRNITSVSGEIDDIALQAVSSSGEVLRCKGSCEEAEDVQIINTSGHAPDPTEPKSLSVNPASKNVWQISGSDTNLGNIWSRTDAGNQDLLEQTRDLDRRRADFVDDLQSDQQRLKSQNQVQDKIDEATDRLRRGRPRLTPEEDPRVVVRKIQDMDLSTSLRVVQIALATVVICLIVYLVLPGAWASGIAFVVVCTGVLMAVSFSTVQR